MSRTEQQLFDDKHRERKKERKKERRKKHYMVDKKRPLLRMDNTKDQKRRTKERKRQKVVELFQMNGVRVVKINEEKKSEIVKMKFASDLRTKK